MRNKLRLVNVSNLIIFLQLIRLFLQSNLPTPQCIIQNNLFKLEYLYTCSDLDQRQYYRRNVYTYNINDLNDVNEIKWTLIPVSILNNAFYLKSNRYSEYLCVSKRIQNHNLNCNFNNYKRMAHTLRLDHNISRLKDKYQCQWRFQKVNSTYIFKIWNILYNQMLFAESHCFTTTRHNKSKRNVYLTHKENLKSYWLIDCLSHTSN